MRASQPSLPDGTPESSGILMGLYAKGNKAQPVDSGWYMVNLNTEQRAAKKAGTVSCNFDACGQSPSAGLSPSIMQRVSSTL